MDKIKEFFGKLVDKFKSMGRLAKISIIVSFIAIIIAAIIFGVYSLKNKYNVLFTSLDPKDAKIVTEKLKELKVDMKIEGDTILVAKDKVDELRLELAPQISNGSVGYELMDQGGSFGMTDEEFQIKKLRMLQGELEKTIKTFPQIENARVHITLPKESVFAKESEPGKAVTYIQVKLGESVEPEQVKSIVSLVAAAVPNLPRNNVEVIDQNMKLLSEGIYDENGNGIALGSTSVENQKTLEKSYEEKLENSVYELLNPVIGKGKVKTQINVQMDFDSKQKTEVTVDPNKVIKNQETLREKNGINSDSTTTNPVDDNMSNTIDEDTGNSGDNYREQSKIEYESGRTEVKTISAPGEVKRVTASVVIDGSLDPMTTEAIKELVSTAIGYKQDRGDQISVMSMNFDQSENEEAKKQIQAMEAEKKKENIKNIIKWSLFALILIIIIISLIIFFRKKKDEEEDENEERLLDIVVDNNVNEVANFEPINFEVNNQKVHVENEIKKYATEKPDQVTDVIKSWLNEDER